MLTDASPSLSSRRAACYRFDTDSNSWKERGRGDVKLLQNKETKAVRVLLRMEKTFKLCMNHKGERTDTRTNQEVCASSRVHR